MLRAALCLPPARASPGYFGPDAPGSCYEVDTVETWVIDASNGALARCFPRK